VLLVIVQAGPAARSDLERLFPASAAKSGPHGEASDLERLFPSSGGDTEEDVEARRSSIRLPYLSTWASCVWALCHLHHYCESVGAIPGPLFGLVLSEPDT